MTINGWTQIAIFALLVAALTKPLGGYMTRVFNGERTIWGGCYGPSRSASTVSAASTRRRSSTG